jgi:hypothetical protein
MKLTKAQLETLKELPCTMSPDYKPIQTLVRIGFARQSSAGGMGNPSYERTPEGDKVLKELEAKHAP